MQKIIGIIVVILLIGTAILPLTITAEKYKNSQSSIKVSVNDFDEKMESMMRFARTPSISACIIEDDNIFWSKSYGLSDISKQKSATTDTTYMIASISKTVVATAILQLYENGYFKLDDDVNEFLPFILRNPNFPDEPITFRMLLAHQSSILLNVPISINSDGVIFFVNKLGAWIHLHDLFNTGFFDCGFYPWIEEIISPDGKNYNSNFWGDYRPGEQASYSGFGYAILGYIIEHLSNQSLEDYCRENIFDPLSMNNTSFYLKNLNQQTISVPYMSIMGAYIPLENYEYHCWNPAAGLYTTVIDLAYFLIAHMNNGIYNGARILEDATINEMHTIQYPDSIYGLGWIEFNPTLEGHTGSNIGYELYMLSRESENDGIILFYNENDWSGFLLEGIYELIQNSIRDNILNLLIEKADEQ